MRTQRLLLRPFLRSDAADVARMAGDPRLSNTLFELPRPYTLDHARTWIDSHHAASAEGRRYTFAVCLHAGGTLVGCITLKLPGPDGIRAELGYWTGAEHWSCGYASEAAGAIIAFGFDQLRLERIEARHLLRNPASGRVMRNAGMSVEATLPAYLRDPHTDTIEGMRQWAVHIPPRQTYFISR